MLTHNLIMICRNFKRNRSTFLINLIGLSTSLACALLIYLWVNDELNVDKFHEKDSQLYQVMQNFKLPDGTVTRDYTPALLANSLLDEMPEVEYAAEVNTLRYRNGPDGVISNGNNHIKARAMFAGRDYFQVFSYNLTQGQKSKVLANKNAVIISEELAKKLFNTTDNIVGKILEWEHEIFKGAYQVSGVFENPPANSTAQFDLIFNYEVFLDNNPESREWYSDDAYTYLILREGTNIDDFNAKIEGFLKSKHHFRSGNTLFVQQYSKRYLYGQYENGVQTGGRIIYVRLFSIIALFILVIACINFMNLSTAKASRRMKEVGVKKTVGANRNTLMVQYLGEALLMAFISLFIAILLVELILPYYNTLTNKNLNLNYNPSLFLSILGITLFTGIVSGSYPAFYLSGFTPVTVLKGKLRTSLGELWVRKGLVVFQFTISVVLIVALLIIDKQIEFIQTKNLGYSKDNIISFKRKGQFKNDFETFMSELKKIPGVANATNIWGGSILENICAGGGFSWEGQTQEQQTLFPTPQVSYDFLETLDIEIIEGRSFSKKYGDEFSRLILNEAAVKMMSFENPIGKTIKRGDLDFQIIGVVKNFHINSLHEKIKPCFIRFRPDGRDIIVKINAGTERITIDRLKKLYQEFHPGFPFEFTFLDDDYQALYESENRVAVLSKYFAGIAIIISCLGLFGLAAFTAQKRQKEIGIRKVLGSSEFGIVYLLSSDFTKIVLSAIVIALPISYLITKNWLNGFEYRVDLKPWYFVTAALVTLIIAWITVGTQAIKAAFANPVESLRNE